jgi:protocatechuate 3,4-dioxygenase beta subunit
MKSIIFSLVAGMLQIMVVGGIQNGISFDPQQLKPPASTSAEKDRCTVSGRVSNLQTGEPVKKATLHLTRRGGSRSANGMYESTGYSGTSEPDGSFKFEAVEPGNYSLTGERPGYIQNAYGSKNGMTAGTAIQLSPGQKLTDLKMQLVPQATISGKVVDEDGDPAGNVSVQALGKTWALGGKPRYFIMGQGSTDDTGVFRIANLRPGKYYVVVQSSQQQMMGMREAPATPGKPDIRPARTFYPGSLDRTSATALDLQPGQDLPGIDIRMRAVQTFHVRGKAAVPLPESNNRPTMLTLMPQTEDGQMFMTAGGMVAKDGTFDFAGVAPGSYTISSAMFSGQQQTFIHQNVEVGSSDVNDVVLTAQSMFSLHGSVDLQGTLLGSSQDKSLENIQVMLTAENDSIMMFSRAFATTKADGSFTIERVMPAKFRVRITNQPEGSYVASIRFGNQEMLGKTLDLTQASGGEIRVSLKAGAAEVSGTVQTKQADPAASTSSALVPATSASVLLIPEDLTLNGGSVHTAGTNQNGSFTAKDLEPGRYYAVAYEPEEYRNFSDPAILKQLVDKGTKVEVKENDKQQLQLNLLAPDELQKAVAAGLDN